MQKNLVALNDAHFFDVGMLLSLIAEVRYVSEFDLHNRRLLLIVGILSCSFHEGIEGSMVMLSAQDVVCHARSKGAVDQSRNWKSCNRCSKRRSSCNGEVPAFALCSRFAVRIARKFNHFTLDAFKVITLALHGFLHDVVVLLLVFVAYEIASSKRNSSKCCNVVVLIASKLLKCFHSTPALEQFVGSGRVDLWNVKVLIDKPINLFHFPTRSLFCHKLQYLWPCMMLLLCSLMDCIGVRLAMPNLLVPRACAAAHKWSGRRNRLALRRKCDKTERSFLFPRPRNDQKKMPGKRGGKRAAAESAEEREPKKPSSGPSKLVDLYVQTIIAPETTSSLPLLYATGPSTQKLVPEATFAKLPVDWPQSGPLTYGSSHRLGSNSAGAGCDYVITDQIDQPLQNLNILGDQATQAGMFEMKNSGGYDGTYRLTAPGGTPNFIVEASAGVTSSVTTQTPSMWTELAPINANYDPTVLTSDIFQSTFYKSSSCLVNALTKDFHGPALPIGRANGKYYFHIDSCNQVFSNNNGNQIPPQAGYSAAVAISPNTVEALVSGATSSCITISEGSSDPDLVNVFPGLAGFAAGDKVTVALNAFKNNTDGNPVLEKSFTIPSTWPPTSGNRLIGILPVPGSDEYRLRISILTAGSAGSTAFRPIQVGFTSCGGYFSHRMAPGMDGAAVQSLATATRLWATGLNVKNWTVLNGRGAIAVVYKMQKGDYYSDAFGIDKGDPYSEMASQPEEIDETFEKGERFFNTPPCEEPQNALRENIDQQTKKRSAIPAPFMAKIPYALYYDLVDRNLTAQCLKSPGIQNNITNLSGGTNVIVNQQQAQNTDATWWCRWEFVANSVDSQVFYKHLPPEAKGLFEIAAGKTAKMKKAGPSGADLSFFLKSEGYLERRQNAQGVGFMTY